MSRVGSALINIPDGVNFSCEDGYANISCGPNKMKVALHKSISVEITADGNIKLHTDSKDQKIRAKWGLLRALINNAVKGVKDKFVVKLEINGVGYRASLKNSSSKNPMIVLSLGYSHMIFLRIPEDLSVEINKNEIAISGCDKQLVGQFAADIRSLRAPEPYKGKGIKYSDEVIIKKEGKKK